MRALSHKTILDHISICVCFLNTDRQFWYLVYRYVALKNIDNTHVKILSHTHTQKKD